MRILKGQEILPDDSTLVQHNISDGATVNIVIEPAKQITVEVFCNLGTFKYEINNCLLVKDLKQKLLDSEQVASIADEFDLETKLSENCTKTLDDDSLPLHEYGIQDDCQLMVVKPHLFLELVSQDGSKKLYKKFCKKTTVNQLKTVIVQYFFGGKDTDLSLFATSDQTTFITVYPKRDEKDVSVGEILSDGQTVYYLEVIKYDFDACYPVKHKDVEIGRVYGARGDTVSIIKLRVQNQLGIPANCVTVILYCSETTINVDATLDNSQVPVVRSYLFLTLMSQGQSKKEYKKVLKKVTVKELEDMVLRLFCDKKDTDISLFVTSDQIKYVKVGPNKDVSVGEVLSNDQTVCYLEDKCDFKNYWPVKHGNVEIGNVYGYPEDYWANN